MKNKKEILQKLIGFDKWHLNCIEEKKYALSIINRVNYLIRKGKIGDGYIVECGCGLGDMISEIRHKNRLGYDIDSKTITGARILHLFGPRFKTGTFENIRNKHISLMIAVNFLHGIAPDEVYQMFSQLVMKNIVERIVVDLVESPPYEYSHDYVSMFADLGYSPEYMSKGYIAWENTRRRIIWLHKNSDRESSKVEDVTTDVASEYLYGKNEDKIRISKLYEFNDCLLSWIRIKQDGIRIDEYLASYGIYKVLVYGKNELGKLLVAEIPSGGVIQETLIADSNDIDDCMRNFCPDLIIVTAISFYEEIEECLRDKIGYLGRVICLDDFVHRVESDKRSGCIDIYGQITERW